MIWGKVPANIHPFAEGEIKEHPIVPRDGEVLVSEVDDPATKKRRVYVATIADGIKYEVHGDFDMELVIETWAIRALRDRLLAIVRQAEEERNINLTP